MEDVLPYKLIDMFVKDAMLLRATHILCAFDGPKNFRKDLYPDYKANREGKVGNGDEYGDQTESAKDKLYACFPALFERLAYFGIPFYQPRKHEADDVLCSIAHGVHDRMKFVGGTQDKDAYQYLLWDSVRLVDTSNASKDKPARWITRQIAEKKKGVTAEQMIDFQTLIGDKLDNIIGIPGMGPATAKAILTKHGSLKKWFASGEDKELIATNKERMRLNRKLVTLSTEVMPPGEIDDWKLSKFKARGADKLSRNYHELHNLMWPKSRGLFG